MLLVLTNLLEMIDANYDAETAPDLTKRVMLSIKNPDNDRFMRSLKGLENKVKIKDVISGTSKKRLA